MTVRESRLPSACRSMKDRPELQRRFLADAAAGRPTRVFVKGRIFTFDAPTNYRHAIGLYMEVGSSVDVLPGSPAGEP